MVGRIIFEMLMPMHCEKLYTFRNALASLTQYSIYAHHHLNYIILRFFGGDLGKVPVATWYRMRLYYVLVVGKVIAQVKELEPFNLQIEELQSAWMIIATGISIASMITLALEILIQ